MADEAIAEMQAASGEDPFCPQHGRRSRPAYTPGLRCDCAENDSAIAQKRRFAALERALLEALPICDFSNCTDEAVAVDWMCDDLPALRCANHRATR